MTPEDDETSQVSPATDLLAGAFFLLWAGVGWYSYFGNPRLRASLFASVDPGPALLPLVTMWALTLGGGFILAKGIWRLSFRADMPGTVRLPEARRHLMLAAFLASMLLGVMLLRQVGFFTVGFVFCTVWLFSLSGATYPGLREKAIGFALAAGMAAVITWSIHFIFVELLLVQLPRPRLF